MGDRYILWLFMFVVAGMRDFNRQKKGNPYRSITQVGLGR